jgi:hypothetical protein
MLLPNLAPLAPLAPAMLAGLALLLCLVFVAQTILQGRSRRQLRRDLARIFEQLDLLALTAPTTASALVPVLSPAAPVSGNVHSANESRLSGATDDRDTIADLIARGADERELATRCGVAPAEAHILIALRSSQRH